MDLPLCHSRRYFEEDPHSYFCAHPHHHFPSGRITAEVCQVCPLWQQPAPAHFLPFPPVVDQLLSVRRLPSLPKPCIYLGEVAGKRPCSSCRGTVWIKAFACAHPQHRETTLDECRTCPDYAPWQSEAAVAP